jgi:hypothetical protein
MPRRTALPLLLLVLLAVESGVGRPLPPPLDWWRRQPLYVVPPSEPLAPDAFSQVLQFGRLLVAKSNLHF